jgi:predicted GTPase
MAQRRVLICGAAGRDFHNFNVVYRDDPDVRVVAFTATQIPGIDERRYPPELAGANYPEGIPIVSEDQLEAVCSEQRVDVVVFAYSDVTSQHVMRLAARALAAGADYLLHGPRSTMINATVPVVAVCAVRTGCGKSQTTRYLSQQFAARGNRVAVVRHPMPYGNLAKQAVQRFASMADLDSARCTLEEREEYEPHIAQGGLVFAGVDYAGIVAQAQSEADVILWDGGNNDFSFIRPDLSIALVDALRPDHLDTHHPGAAVLRMADVVVVNKVHAASESQLHEVRRGLASLVPQTPVVLAASPVSLDDPEAVAGARVLIVEDGPTITHGGMPFGAGYQAVLAAGPAEIVDPRASATESIARVFEAFPHIGPVLPAMGYSPDQLVALAKTINDSGAEIVVAGTPIDFAREVAVSVPVVRARYSYADASFADGGPGLMSHVDERLTL